MAASKLPAANGFAVCVVGVPPAWCRCVPLGRGEIGGWVSVMFSVELKKLRTEYGLTQAELARRLGISASAVGMYEQGRREPDSELLARLARMFHVSTDVLLGIREEPQAQQEVNTVIDRFTNILKNQQGLMFNGAPLSEADREKIVNAIRVAAAIAIPEEGENDESKD